MLTSRVRQIQRIHSVINTEPDVEPVTLAEAKQWLRVHTTADNAVITNLITAARKRVEVYLGRALITQTWDLWLTDWPEDNYIEIPKPSLQSVTHVKYYDDSDTEYTLSTSVYYVSTKRAPGRVVLRSGQVWPSTSDWRTDDAVNVRYIAGYGDEASDVPEAIRRGILVAVANWYENREGESDAAYAVQIESAQDLPMTAKHMIDPFRVFRVA